MVDTARRDQARRNGWRGVPPAVIGLAAVLCLVGIGLVVGRAVADDGPDCSAVGSRVAGLEGFAWDNGITSMGSEWVSVLTDGVTEADETGRREIAGAVRTDEAGYQRFRDALPDDATVAADRLRDAAADPESVDTTGMQDIRESSEVLRRRALDECGLV